MEYRLPNQKDEIILNEYMAEHRKNGEKTISASLDLAGMEYGKWLENVQENAEYGSEEWGKNIVYLCFDKNSLIGLLNIRYELPKDLSLIYGDIGYGVRPSQRICYRNAEKRSGCLQGKRNEECHSRLL